VARDATVDLVDRIDQLEEPLHGVTISTVRHSAQPLSHCVT
jgi:hypothetical protein